MTAIAVTAVIGVLAVTVAMLSYKAATRESTSSVGDVSALEARLDALSGELATAQTTARTAAADAKASLALARKAGRTTTQQPGLAHCLVQMQHEIEDLQAYLAYRTPPRRGRVTGACRTLLTPRY